MIMNENKVLSRISLTVLLLISMLSNHLNCQAIDINSNAKQMTRLSYPKIIIKNANSVIPSVGSALSPSILSDYYNSILSNSAQNMRRFPVNVWPQSQFIPLSNNVDEYEDIDEYYNDDNTDAFRPSPSDIFYGNDVSQPDGWFNGPVIDDTPTPNKISDEQMNGLMLTYLLEQLDKTEKLKQLNNKRAIDESFANKEMITTLSSVTTTPEIANVITKAIPKKLTAKQFRLFQRGQKEVPLLRPFADDKKRSDNWPKELDETNLSQEESLMNLKRSKGQLRRVRDVLTAQLDSLKKEGPKMH